MTDAGRVGVAGSLLLAVLASGCSLTGYPGSPPPPGPGPDPATDGPARAGGEPGVVGRDPGAYDDGSVPRAEPRSRYGNPPSYEVDGREYHVMESAEGYDEVGVASWYGDEFAGRRTSSGETFDPRLLTAAHRSLPLPTWVEVTNLDNGLSVVVRVNDRGPFARTRERIIDLSEEAARRLGMVGAGTAPVRVRALRPDELAGGPVP